jgi:hypothetical protein
MDNKTASLLIGFLLASLAHPALGADRPAPWTQATDFFRSPFHAAFDPSRDRTPAAVFPSGNQHPAGRN